jgi:hypothetical protein
LFIHRFYKKQINQLTKEVTITLTVIHNPTTTTATIATILAETIPTTEPVLRLLEELVVPVKDDVGAAAVSLSPVNVVEGTENVV